MKNGLKDGDVFHIAIVMMARVQWTCYLGAHIASTYEENNFFRFVTICITMIFFDDKFCLALLMSSEFQCLNAKVVLFVSMTMKCFDFISLGPIFLHLHCVVTLIYVKLGLMF